jgi:hypothetical protein
MKLLPGFRTHVTGVTRVARKDGRVVARLTVAHAGQVIEAEAFPPGESDPVLAGPYHFASPAEAGAFLEEAVEALTYLGCEVD